MPGYANRSERSAPILYYCQNNLKFAESQRQRFRDMYGEDVPIDRMITIQIPVMPDDMYQR